MNKILLKIKYPKFLLLILTFIIAYILFNEGSSSILHDYLLSLGYIGTFLVGILFVYGFTAAPATAILLILAKEQNILLAGFIAGFGALIGDLIIFKFIRYSFSNEIKRLSKERVVLYLNRKSSGLFKSFKKYTLYTIAGFIIASPLPDEIGVSLLAVSGNISTKIFSVISYLLNTIGIFIILILGNSI